MKKILRLGVLALAVAAISQQQASAWTNFKFGAGVNLGYQSGGNTLLWGAHRSAQPPAPDCGYGCPGGAPYGGGGHAPMPYFGQQAQPPMPQYGYQPPPPAPAPIATQSANVPAYYRPLPVYNGAYYYPANNNR